MNRAGLYGKYSVKGNLLLHYLQYQVNQNSMDVDGLLRFTNDIDIAMRKFNDDESLRETFIESIRGIVIHGVNVTDIKIKKEPGDIRTSWQIQLYQDIYNGKRKQKLFKIDVNGKGFLDEDVMIYNIKGDNFYGSNINKIMADKLSSISSDYIRKRVKDVYDIMILLHFDYDIDKVAKKVCESEHYSEFEYFDNHKDEIIEQLKRILTYGRFNAEEVYRRVYDLVSDVKALRGPITGVWG